MGNTRGIRQVKIIKVIKTTTVIGSGTEKDPVRDVVQYWDKKGKLICKKDPFTKKAKIEHPDRPIQHQ